MSANVENFKGGVFISRNGSRRMSRTSVTVKGIDFDVEYLVDGAFLAATDVDAEERPTVDLRIVEINGEEVQHVLSESVLEAITCAIEGQL